MSRVTVRNTQVHYMFSFFSFPSSLLQRHSMDADEVVLQAHVGGETEATQVANKGLLARVRPGVSLRVRQVRRLVRAQPAKVQRLLRDGALAAPDERPRAPHLHRLKHSNGIPTI